MYGAYYNLLQEPDLAVELPARLRGRLRLTHADPDHRRHRHLIMVGDRVVYRAGEKDQPVSIEALLPRRNALYRAIHARVQALGANLDRAIILLALAEPEPNFRFLDRLLVSCHASAIEPIILFSKADLVEPDSAVMATVDEYKDLGYRCFALNLLDPGLEQNPAFQALRTEIAVGASVIVGRSGTGKSTLLNRLLGSAFQKTDEISSVGKGRHTTTNSTLFLYNERQAFLIDTPGVKEWGIAHVESRQVLAGFPELMEFLSRCEFSDCSHAPGARGCAVQVALEQSRATAAGDSDAAAPLSVERLYSLLAMLDSPG